MKMKKLLLPALALFSCLSAEAQFTDMGGQKAGDSKGNWYIGVGSGFHTNFMRYSDLDEDYYPDSKNLCSTCSSNTSSGRSAYLPSVRKSHCCAGEAG